MHYLQHLVAAAALTAPFAFAQNLNDIPACAAKIAQEGFANAGCALTDYKCLCTATPFVKALSTDVQKACSADDYAKIATFAKKLCFSVGVNLAANSSSPPSTAAPSAASNTIAAASSEPVAASSKPAAASPALSPSSDASSSSSPISATESSAATSSQEVSSSAALGSGTVAAFTYTHTLTHALATVDGSGDAQATAADTAAMSQASTGTYSNGSYGNATNGSVATGSPTQYAASGDANRKAAWEWTAAALIFGAGGAWGLL